MKEPFEINFKLTILFSALLSPILLYIYYIYDNLFFLIFGSISGAVLLFSLAYQIVFLFYFNSRSFKQVKAFVINDVEELNQFNRYLESLKNTGVRKTAGTSINATSKTKFRRSNAGIINQDYYKPYEYRCSSTIVRNARIRPYEYICKYFGYKGKEKDTLEIFQSALNNYIEIEQGTATYYNDREIIINNIAGYIPAFIQVFAPRKLRKELGFTPFNQEKNYFPKFSFAYRSPAGYSMDIFTVEYDIKTTEKFIAYLNHKINELESVKRQRALMTRTLRRQILERDNYTCQICGNSIFNEPNLCLHIDHIVSINKGGKTEESNLQTLCWKCNLKKSSK